jgi:hypothetical protein
MKILLNIILFLLEMVANHMRYFKPLEQRYSTTLFYRKTMHKKRIR